MVIRDNGVKLESGLFGAICMAYSGHHNLQLRPDDIWLAIAQGVSSHLQYRDNAEKYRHVFVDHEGSEEIAVSVDGLHTGDEKLLRWPECIQLIVTQLERRVKGDTGQLLVNDFSTTDVTSKTASQIVLMDAMKYYIDYTFCLMCGIPSVTLQGTLADWQRLQEKARALRALDIGLDTWLDKLDPVLGTLVETYRGKVDEDWWSRVVRVDQQYGSGPAPAYITGWMTSFFPYEVSGGKVRRPTGDTITSDKIPRGMVECPFVINDNGVKTAGLLVAGSCGVSVTEDGRGVMPCIGWLVKKAPPEEE